MNKNIRIQNLVLLYFLYLLFFEFIVKTIYSAWGLKNGDSLKYVSERNEPKWYQVACRFWVVRFYLNFLFVFILYVYLQFLQ